MPAKNLPLVRELAGKSPPGWFGRCTRVNIRIDFYPNTGRIDYSIIAWEHPNARVILNEVTEEVGPLLHEVLLVDVMAQIATLFDEWSGPFGP